MKRLYQGVLMMSAAALIGSQSHSALAQATEQNNAPAVAPTSQNGSAPAGYGGAASPFPRGGMSSFPRGYQSPANPASPSGQTATFPSGQGGSRIPYPRSAASFPGGNQPMPGSGPATSAQSGGGGTGGYGWIGHSQKSTGASSQLPGGVAAQKGGAGASDQAGAPGAAGKRYPGAGMEGAGVPGATGLPGLPEAVGPGGAGPGGIPPGTAGLEPGAGVGVGAGAGAGAYPGAAGIPGTAGVSESTGAAMTSAAEFEELAGDVGAGAAALFTPNMIGDLIPYYSRSVGSVSPPPPIHPRGSSLFFPSVRNFKVSENQSPRPQDRVFFDFNYYNNVNSAINTAERTPIDHMKAYTYMWGFEKTFDNGNGSIGLRLPLNSLTANSTDGSPTPTSTALGNLDIIAKYILKQNYDTGSLITVGLELTPSTATSRFAGAPYVASLNTTYFQPFIAYLWKRDRFYVQGFSGLDVPVNNADVTLLYNDIGMGYFVYRDTDTRNFLTAIAPTFEVHANAALNHRNPYNTFDLAASANTCNLTYGLNLMFYGRSMLTAALVTPVSNPKPFDTELAVFFNYYFGRTARTPSAITPPVVQ
jgi:hypothetical protein